MIERRVPAETPGEPGEAELLPQQSERSRRDVRRRNDDTGVGCESREQSGMAALGDETYDYIVMPYTDDIAHTCTAFPTMKNASSSPPRA